MDITRTVVDCLAFGYVNCLPTTKISLLYSRYLAEQDDVWFLIVRAILIRARHLHLYCSSDLALSVWTTVYHR